MKPIRRIYRVTDANLIQLADDMYHSAIRDLAELAHYGVTMTVLTTIMADRDGFSDYQTDQELMGAMISATQQRDATMGKVREEIDRIVSRVRFKWSEQSGEYRRFGVFSISRQKPTELLYMGKRVVQMATEYLSDLASEGLTMGIITNLDAQLQNLDAEILEQKNSIKERDYATFKRTELGNKLYTGLALLAEKGKLCWKFSNEALYNDYIIHEKSNPKVQVVSGKVSPAQAVNVSVADVEPESTFILTNTGPSVLHFYFTNDPVYEPDSHVVEVPANSSLTITAVDIGYDEGVSNTLLNVFNPEAMDGSYEVEWD